LAAGDPSPAVWSEYDYDMSCCLIRLTFRWCPEATPAAHPKTIFTKRKTPLPGSQRFKRLRRVTSSATGSVERSPVEWIATDSDAAASADGPAK